jgi:hypothetical protein
LTNEVGTGKTFTLFLIIQGLLRHYNKQIHVDSLKQKTLLMAYISKTTFNIDGTIIHLTLSIPLNCKHLPSLTSKHLDISLKTYSNLNLLVLDEISLIGNEIFSFIDYRLRAIKQTCHHFFGNLDVIIIGDLHQVPLTRDSWVFKPK